MGTKPAKSIKTFPKDEDAIRSVDQTPSLWLSKRFLVAVVIFLCFINIKITLTNMNIAIIEMTSAKSIVMGNVTTVRPAEFQWDPSVVGIVTSVIAYGGLFALGGNIFLNRLGGSMSCAFFIALCGIFNVLLPVTLYIDFKLFIVFRLLTGFFANCFSVSVAEIFSRWFPKREQSTLICFCMNGMNVGGTIVNPLFGYIADRLGWQMVFYVSGTMSVVASLLCLIVVKNLPTQDVRISEEELAYIVEGTQETSRKKISHPYKEIFLSPPVWALCVTEFVLLWMNNITNACLPSYAKDLTGRSTDKIGFLSAIPTAFTIILYPLAGRLMDYWKNRSHIDRTRLDKTILGCALLFMSIFFAACAIFSNFTASLVIFVLIQITGLATQAVFDPNVVNIAPNDSSIVAALIRVGSSLGTIVCRTVTGFMTINHTSQEWNNCFLLSSGIVILGAVIFVKLGSSEPQRWSLSTYTEEECDYLIKIKNRNVH